MDREEKAPLDFYSEFQGKDKMQQSSKATPTRFGTAIMPTQLPLPARSGSGVEINEKKESSKIIRENE